MIHTDKGTWIYQYNAFDELVEQTTAKGDVSILDYDIAGRLVRRFENEGTSCWNYNATTGRMDNEKVFNDVNKSLSQCQTDNDNHYQKYYFFDSHGRVEQSDVSIQNINANSDGTYVTSTSFDEFGRVRVVIYPNELSIENIYQNGYLKQLKNLDTERVYQSIDSMNAYGQVTDVTYANGASEAIGYKDSNGQVDRHSLNKSGNKHLLSYLYDDNGNITYRRHEFKDKGYTDWSETLTYDSLNRLDLREMVLTDDSYLSTGFKADQNYNYDDWGNLTYKYGVGAYYYADTLRKNRLTSTSNSVAYTFSYDANGNITNDGNGRSFTYFSFDKVNRITQGSIYSEFLYGSNRARYYKYDKRTESSQTAHYYTTYVGAYEKIHRTGGGKSMLTEHKVNLGNIVITERSDGTDAENYLHKDHLGSTISVTDKVGAVVQQFTYDPWGKQTKIYQTSSFLDLIYSQPTNRGYTGHEHIRDLDIVHMNGRIYDANIGRFMQADPNIQNPGNFQNYNRYSYVLNNPLSMTDPSGFFFVKKIGRKLIRSAVRIFGAKLVNLIGTAVATYFGGPLGAAGWTYEFNRAMGVSSTGALRSAAIAYVGARVGGASTGNPVGDFFVQGIAGGVMSDLQGGNFGHGFWAAGLNSAVGGTNATQNPIANVIVSGVLGGTISKITGGKFSNGASSAAFAAILRQDWSKLTSKGAVRVIGKIYITGHYVAWVGPVHTAIEYIDVNGKLTVISAGPKDGVLFSEADDVNGFGSDAPDDNFTIDIVSVPKGMTPKEYINVLITADGFYGDKINYNLFPGIQGSHNSNSFIRGILQATGGSTSINWNKFFGGNDPVPSCNFTSVKC